MIYKISKKELFKINNSFINKEFLEKEFENNPYAKMLVLEENQEIIGFIYYSDIYDRAEINLIEIKKNHRNCGKGDKLLKELIKIVEKDITLEVKEDNFPAIKLYKKNGFIKEAIRKGYYNGTDGILMQRKKDSILDK